MSAVPTGFANDTTTAFVNATNGVLTGTLREINAGSIVNLSLTTPIVLGAPFAPGGTATQFNLSLQPVGVAPHAQVALRLNFYDATGALIGTQDVV